MNRTIRIWLWVSGIFALVMIVVGLIGGYYSRLVWNLLTGWIEFLHDNLGRMQVDPWALATGLMALVLLIFVLHRLFRRSSHRPTDSEAGNARWRVRTTVAVVALVALSFTAGLSAVGIKRETPQIAEALRKNDQRGGKSASESTVRPRAEENLRQVGMALDNHDSAQGSLPVATVFDGNGRALHGWQYTLLPFIEQQNLFNRIDTRKLWSDPANREWYQKEISVYLHPVVPSTRDGDGYPITTWAANVHVMGREHSPKIADFGRGASNTMLVGEAHGNFKPWGYPLNVRDPKLGLKRSPDGFGGPWRAGTHFLMADGSVRTFRDDADPEFLKLLAEPGR